MAIVRRLLLLVCAGVGLAGRAPAQPVDPNLFDGLRWRLVGPFRGGRTLTAQGVSGQPNLFYFGAVGGGVWKSENAGRTWEPIFDSQPIASIGALAVAPSDPKERDWKPIAAGGENDWITPDPKDPDVVWGGRVGRFDRRTLQEQDVDPTLAYLGDYRSEWTLPLGISPRGGKSKAIYFANQFLNARPGARARAAVRGPRPRGGTLNDLTASILGERGPSAGTSKWRLISSA